MLTALSRHYLRYFGVFFRHTRGRLFVIAGLALLMSYAEGLGIALFFPILQRGAANAEDSISATLSRVFAWLHIPTTPEAALPILAGAFVLKGVLQFCTMSYQTRSAAFLGRRLRRMLVDSLRDADYRYVLGARSGFHANLLTSEVTRASKGFLGFVRTLAPTANIAIFLGIVFVLDWRTTLVCIGMGAATTLIVGSTGRVAKDTSRVTTTQSAALSAFIIQAVQAFKYLRATAGFDRLQRRIDASSDRLESSEARTGAANAALQSVSQPVMVLFLVPVLYYRLVIQGENALGLFVLLGYFFRISGEISRAQINWQSFVSFIASIDVVESALADADRHAEPRGRRPFSGLARAFGCANVDFAYAADGAIVLRGVSLTIARHSTVAFVGESGAGKSTLVDLLTGTLRPTTGRVFFDDTDLEDLNVEAVRARVGYVPQDPVLFDDTIANNITLWADAPRDRLVDAARRAKCLEFIEALPRGFDSAIGERGLHLSGGQRQRLAIARELFKRPEILVLDEATSALDSESELAIQQSIDELQGQMTILIVAHRLATIRGADRIYVMDAGRIVEEGSFRELRARPGSRFQRMCELQSLHDLAS
jgi:subfamily B ATP-binding cassette protein MsbA